MSGRSVEHATFVVDRKYKGMGSLLDALGKEL
jgi:hypothetical protein